MSPQIVTISEKRVAMTNQNMVISDAKSAGGRLTMSMAIAVAISKSSLLAPENYFPTKSRVDGCRIAAALLDSMRASSPTRSRPNNNDDDAKDHHFWIIRHPSALSTFGHIVRALEGKQIAVFLDYDGTLSPIVDDPDRAFITTEMREVVRDVAKFFPTAIVSGRCRAKVHSFVKLSELYYAGSHGMDIKGPTKGRCKKGTQSVLCQPAKEFLPMIDEIYKALIERVKYIAGAKVENNKFCLSVHYRCVDETKWGELAEQVKMVIKDYPRLRLSPGRKVLEIRPVIKWDKGNALEFLLESLGYADSENVFPVYLGDDRTDEDAFRVLRDRGQGLGILVSKVPKETNASYSLQEPSEVMEFLKRLVEWKKLSLPRHY